MFICKNMRILVRTNHEHERSSTSVSFVFSKIELVNVKSVTFPFSGLKE
jgi:hypothetical protein